MKEGLSATHPELAAQWHPMKNGDLTPDQVIPGSAKKVWWQCANYLDHEWLASVVKRTAEGQGCPFCAGKRISATNSLACLFPGVAGQWHPTKNGELTPKEVLAGSTRSYWWQCPNGPDHEWQASVGSRTCRG